MSFEFAIECELDPEHGTFKIGLTRSLYVFERGSSCEWRARSRERE